MNEIYDQMMSAYELDIWSNDYFIQLANMLRFE